MLNSTDNLLNKTIQCMYHNKYRQGKVVSTKNRVVTIEYNIPGTDKPQYRSLHAHDIHGLKVL